MWRVEVDIEGGMWRVIEGGMWGVEVDIKGGMWGANIRAAVNQKIYIKI